MPERERERKGVLGWLDGRGAKRREGWRRRGNGVVVLLECGLKWERYGVGINGGGRHRHSQEAERERERERASVHLLCARARKGRWGREPKGTGLFALQQLGSRE